MSSPPDEGPTRPGHQSPQGKDDPTIVLPQGAGIRFSVPMQDPSGDKLLLGVPRLNFENRSVPALGGIPLVAKIGQGGMGAVYLGYKIMLKREVAVKVLPLHMAQQHPQLVERFLREAQVAAKIESPHLVQVSDVNQIEGLFYLTMEYVHGLSAGAYLKKAVQAGERGLDEATALDVCIAATTGLAAAHAEGVIHRDVKPDNVLVPKDRQSGAFLFSASRIVDLGLARADDVQEKAEWMTWALQQFAQTREGKTYTVNLMLMSSSEAQAAVLKDDSRIHVWSPPSGLFRDALVQTWQRRHAGNPIEREEHLALTPFVFLMFEDRYQAFVKRYQTVSLQTLAQALQEKAGWEGIAQKKEWGRFAFALSDPREHNNGLAALMLVANHLFQKDQDLTAQEVEAQSFLIRARALQPGFVMSGSSMQIVRDMVLKGPSAFDGAFTYESAVISNLASAEGRWGGMRLTYPDINFWNDNPYYILAAPWSSAAQKAGATAFLEFLMTEPIQKQLLTYGFRPGNPKVPIIFPESPFERYKNVGLRVDIPVVAENPSLAVLGSLQRTAQQLGSRR